MYFLGLGVVLLVLKYLEVGPVAIWSWWIVLAPLVLAVAWWAWADASGYTKRKEVEKEDRRRDKRIAKHRDAMGLPPKRPR